MVKTRKDYAGMEYDIYDQDPSPQDKLSIAEARAFLNYCLYRGSPKYPDPYARYWIFDEDMETSCLELKVNFSVKYALDMGRVNKKNRKQ